MRPEGAQPAWRPSAYVVVEHSHKILMVEPHWQEWGKFLDLPGGGLEFGEDLRECAIRECHEETGYRVEIVNVMPFWIAENNLYYYDEKHDIEYFWHGLAHFYAGKLVSEEQDTSVLGKHEIAKVHWVPLEDLVERPHSSLQLPVRPYHLTPLKEGIYKYRQHSGGWALG